MKNVFSSVESGSVSADGKVGSMTIALRGSPAITIDLDREGIEDLTSATIKTALAMGAQQGVEPLPTDQTLTPVVLPAAGMGVMLGPQGHALFVVRLGCLDLAFQIESSRIEAIGQQLAQLGAVLGSEPQRVQ